MSSPCLDFRYHGCKYSFYHFSNHIFSTFYLAKQISCYNLHYTPFQLSDALDFPQQNNQQAGGPVWPGQPVNPTWPGQPANPTWPAQPNQPGWPAQPNQPGWPGQSYQPTWPGQPGQPSAPGWPGPAPQTGPYVAPGQAPTALVRCLHSSCISSAIMVLVL